VVPPGQLAHRRHPFPSHSCQTQLGGNHSHSRWPWRLLWSRRHVGARGRTRPRQQVFFAGPGRFKAGGPEVELINILYASAAGGVFGVANILLTTGITLAGLSIAFPLCIGTALVLGTILTYAVDPRGKPELIFPGVVLALLGVLANARSYGLLQKHRERDQRALDARSSEAALNGAGTAAKIDACRNMTICIVGGVLMSFWAPLSAQGMKGDGGLSPYFSFLFFALAALVVSLAIIAGQQCGCSLIPRVGGVTSAREYFRLPIVLHGWGLLGGAVWALGTAANLVSGSPLGPALSYALGQTAPLVAVLWGLGWYGEFTGAPRSSVWCLVAMFVLFIGAIALLCVGGT